MKVELTESEQLDKLQKAVQAFCDTHDVVNVHTTVEDGVYYACMLYRE